MIYVCIFTHQIASSHTLLFSYNRGSNNVNVFNYKFLADENTLEALIYLYLDVFRHALKVPRLHNVLCVYMRAYNTWIVRTWEIVGVIYRLTSNKIQHITQPTHSKLITTQLITFLTNYPWNIYHNIHRKVLEKVLKKLAEKVLEKVWEKFWKKCEKIVAKKFWKKCGKKCGKSFGGKFRIVRW